MQAVCAIKQRQIIKRKQSDLIKIIFYLVVRFFSFNFLVCSKPYTGLITYMEFFCKLVFLCNIYNIHIVSIVYVTMYWNKQNTKY